MSLKDRLKGYSGFPQTTNTKKHKPTKTLKRKVFTQNLHTMLFFLKEYQNQRRQYIRKSNCKLSVADTKENAKKCICAKGKSNKPVGRKECICTRCPMWLHQIRLACYFCSYGPSVQNDEFDEIFAYGASYCLGELKRINSEPNWPVKTRRFLARARILLGSSAVGLWLRWTRRKCYTKITRRSDLKSEKILFCGVHSCYEHACMPIRF